MVGGRNGLARTYGEERPARLSQSLWQGVREGSKKGTVSRFLVSWKMSDSMIDD